MKHIGSYELLKPLATGGMAEVFLARSTSSLNHGKVVALKRTLPNFLDSPDLCQMFLDEIRVSACLNHQNIVQMCDFGQVDNQAFMVMEYIHGVPLRELIASMRNRRQFLDLPFILYIIKAVAEAMEYAYNAIDPNTGSPLHLIHRDISPQNIMLGFNGEVKVIDFGIAKATAASGQTQHGTIKGKIAYMSPEQAFRQQVDHRSDIFSLGILLWELLANRRFFAGPNVKEVREAIRRYQLTPYLFDETDGLKIMQPILEKMLHHDREHRYEKARDLCSDIHVILSKNYPSFSSLDFSIFMKDLFSEFYENSQKEIKRLLLGEETRTDRINLSTTENTLQTTSLSPQKSQPSHPVLTPAPLRPVLVPQEKRFPQPYRKNIQRTLPRSRPNSKTSNFVANVLGMILLVSFGYLANKEYGPQLKSLYEIHVQKPGHDYLTISFVSSAPGSLVKVNGQTQSRPTPLQTKLLKGQRYQIEISRPGYQTRSFELTPTQSMQYKIQLSPIPIPLNQIAQTSPQRTTKRKPATSKK